MHRTVIDDFSQRLVDVVRKARVGDLLDPATQIGPMANRPHCDSVLARIDAAEAAGHKMLSDGRTACRDQGCYIGPIIFADVPNSADLTQNEVFDPVVSTESWEDEAEVIKTANDTIYGLAAGIWTRNVAKGMSMLHADEICLALDQSASALSFCLILRPILKRGTSWTASATSPGTIIRICRS